ncbi:5-dehydro-4-deoxy-D-glucuronate isomerase [Nakamurella leprariae]|uniref:4-deoxy-L-threo-5-hexosulose-uronate ketol-isomerase n=1 Tax=Nakamurella leprariae TaxID=2803911 RepID=A0A938Y9W9_9ACTN|nr:5-dehydro-4-deoxy-D-glucuronate isomerase [Nakamurella leprariae]MBM9468570.1 5-dehydro-4-deoxy-D-glucuronate isomerase [Nakamurella leprariae]
MEIRHATHPRDFAAYGPDRVREQFLVQSLFRDGEITTVYTHHDRMVIGGAVPTPGAPLTLDAPDPLRAEYFCQRRELAVVGISGSAEVTVDGTTYPVGPRDILYVGRGARDITFAAGPAGSATDGAAPVLYLVSAPAHAEYPTALVPVGESLTTEAGDQAHGNLRTVHKHIHLDGVRSCQLVVGITAPQDGNVWNSMPCHLHDRRTEIYLYFDLPATERVIHVMGEPQATRSLVVADREAVISPSWSVHFGSGSTNYAFVWAMAGENQEFTDMDQIAVADLR